jgi:hypothetical protein
VFYKLTYVSHSNEYTQGLCAQLFSDVVANSVAVGEVQLLEVSDLGNCSTHIVVRQSKVVLKAEYFESGTAGGGSKTSQLVTVKIQHFYAEPTDRGGQLGQHCTVHIYTAGKVEALKSLQSVEEATETGSCHIQTVADGNALQATYIGKL